MNNILLITPEEEILKILRVIYTRVGKRGTSFRY